MSSLTREHQYVLLYLAGSIGLVDQAAVSAGMSLAEAAHAKAIYMQISTGDAGPPDEEPKASRNDRRAALVAAFDGSKLPHACTKCGKPAVDLDQLIELFGLRAAGGKEGAAERSVPQPWCKSCKSSSRSK